MSITPPVRNMFAPLPPTYLPEIRRQVWGRLFGLSIQAARTEADMSIEEAAGLSGMQLSEWMAIEDGHVPQDMDRLRAMAAALEINFDKLANMVLLCRGAWEL
jgi:hypothetical protein